MKARASVAAGNCYIFGSAEGLPEKLDIKENDMVIFCDGGLKYADRVQKENCFLFGDLDSCKEEMLMGLWGAYEGSRAETMKEGNSVDEKSCLLKEREGIRNYFESRKSDTEKAGILRSSSENNYEGSGSSETGKQDCLAEKDTGLENIKNQEPDAKEALKRLLNNSELDYAGKRLSLRLFPVRKDDTDTALAVKHAIKKKCSRIYLYGCCGGDRPDHFLANLALLSLTAGQGKQALLYDGHYSYTMIGNGAGRACTEIRNSSGKRYSCFAYGGNVTGLTLTGFEYETEDITLQKDVSLGAGNTIKGDTAKISIKTGQLLIVTETEPNKVIQ